MRIGFHYHIPAIEYDGYIWMPGYLGLFIDSLASKCEELVCFQHSPDESVMDQMDYSLQMKNVQLVDLGPHTSVPMRTLSAYFHRYIYKEWQNILDVMVVRAPTPLLPVLASVWKKPLSLLLVSDAVEGIDNLPQPRWRKELIRLWAKWNQAQQLSIAKETLTFVNSRLLYDQLLPKIPSLILTQTTTLCENDFYERFDTCASPPYRLLYAGRIARIKGLFEIVEALFQVVNSGWNAVLDLVGMVEKNDSVLDDLFEQARLFGIEDRVLYHGYKTAGTDLLAYYRRADIYVIASQGSSEGFPRTIWEAMASSLPVIATQVGSIPAYIRDAALLVPPKQVSLLTNAILTLLEEPFLRQELIQKGMTLARANTLEKRTEELIGHISQWMNV